MTSVAVFYLIWGIFPPRVGQEGSFIPKSLLSKVLTFVQKGSTELQKKNHKKVQLILNQYFLTQPNK